jgi:hypothetical protein
VTKAEKLAARSVEARDVRAQQTNPDVVALKVERVRTWVDRLVWAGIVLGLLFTMANVQHLAASGSKPPWEHGGSVDWLIAWLLDPMVSLVLIGVLMGEQVINRHAIKAGAWVGVIKWVALGCTYTMNTWSAWASLWGSPKPSQILLHSVPPVIVVCATEAITDLRLNITRAVTTAYQAASASASAVAETAVPAVAPLVVREQFRVQVADAVRTGSADAARTDAGPASRTDRTDRVRTEEPVPVSPPVRTAGRTEGLARMETRTAGTAVERERVVADLAAQLREAVTAGEKWVPDYRALMTGTGYGRSWCEKVVRDARRAATFPPEPQTRTDDDAAARTDGADEPRTEATEPAHTGDEPDRTDAPDEGALPGQLTVMTAIDDAEAA